MLLEKIVPIFFIFGITLYLKNKHVFQKIDARVINKILFNLVIPATIINAFSSVSFTPQLLLLPALGIIVVVLMLGIGYVLGTILNLPRKTKSAFIISFPTLEGGTVGYVFMLSAFGKDGLVPIALFDLGNSVCFFCLIFFVAYMLGHSKEKQFDMSAGLTQLGKSPVIWSFAVAVLLNINHVHIDMLASVVGTMSQATLFLIMVLLALEFEPSLSALRLPLLTILLKTCAGFTIGVLITSLLHIRGVEQIAIVVGASLPSSLMTLIYSSENNLDSQFVANLLSIALPCAFLFDATLMFILGMG